MRCYCNKTVNVSAQIDFHHIAFFQFVVGIIFGRREMANAIIYRDRCWKCDALFDFLFFLEHLFQKTTKINRYFSTAIGCESNEFKWNLPLLFLPAIIDPPFRKFLWPIYREQLSLRAFSMFLIGCKRIRRRKRNWNKKIIMNGDGYVWKMLRLGHAYSNVFERFIRENLNFHLFQVWIRKSIEKNA